MLKFFRHTPTTLLPQCGLALPQLHYHHSSSQAERTLLTHLAAVVAENPNARPTSRADAPGWLSRYSFTCVNVGVNGCTLLPGGWIPQKSLYRWMVWPGFIVMTSICPSPSLLSSCLKASGVPVSSGNVLWCMGMTAFGFKNLQA